MTPPVRRGIVSILSGHRLRALNTASQVYLTYVSSNSTSQKGCARTQLVLERLLGVLVQYGRLLPEAMAEGNVDHAKLLPAVRSFAHHQPASLLCSSTHQQRLATCVTCMEVVSGWSLGYRYNAASSV
jgi:hypothetical protein